LAETLDEGELDDDGRPVTDCSNPLWDPTSISAATCLVQGLAKNQVSKSRIMWRLRGDPGSPLVPILDADGNVVGEVADLRKLKEWGVKDRAMRQQNQKRGKKL
jgi:hypothetical protein